MRSIPCGISPVFLLFYISVSAANAQGFAPARLAVESFGWGATAGGWSVEEHPRLMGDVNGDGRADIVGFGESGTVVSLGQPDGSLTPRVRVLDNFGAGRSGGGWGGLDGPARTQPRHLADVNGDGRDDIIGFGVDGTWVALAQSENPFGETFGEPRRVLSSFGADAAAGGWGEVLRQKYEIYPRLLGDVNGDGQADIVGFSDRGVWVALATGNGGFAEPSRVLSRFGASPAAGGWEGLRHPRLLGDVNGDGRADIVGFGESGTLVSLGHADGTFTEPSRVLVSFGAHAEAGNWAPVVDVDGIATVIHACLVT
jgi:FG-GAP-like repeat